MKFKTPGSEPIMIGLTSGHTLTILPTGTDTPVIFRKAALERGCVPVGIEVEAGSAGTGPTKAQVIEAAIEKLLNGDDEGAFTGDGRPNADKLSEAAGFKISASERDAAWADYQAKNPAGDGED